MQNGKLQWVLALGFVLAMSWGNGGLWGQYSVNFEGTGETKIGYASATVSLSGKNWDLTETLIGTEAGELIGGSRTARLRGYGTSAMTMLADKSNGLGTISFSYKRYGTDTQVDWKVEYSINGGSSWTQIGLSFTAPANDNIQTFSQAVNITGNIRIRIKRATESGTANRRLNIDDIILTDYSSSCTPPTTQASSFGSANIAYNQMDISFTRGNGTGGVLVLAKAGSAVSADPAASTTYTANAAFGSGDQIGTGNYVVYNGTAGGAGNASGNITITGLSATTTYHFAVYEYDGASGSECYRTSDKLTGNATTSAGPTITVSPTALTGFTYNQGSGPSASQSYTLSASNLTPAAGDLTVTGSANYEVSTDNSTFSGSVDVDYTGSALASTPIYVRLKAGLSAGTYNSETIANSGANTIEPHRNSG